MFLRHFFVIFVVNALLVCGQRVTSLLFHTGVRQLIITHKALC